MDLTSARGRRKQRGGGLEALLRERLQTLQTGLKTLDMGGTDGGKFAWKERLRN